MNKTHCYIIDCPNDAEVKITNNDETIWMCRKHYAGIVHSIRSFESNRQSFSIKMWGWPSFGIGKLRLRFSQYVTYTIVMAFITPWLALGIHIPSWKNK